MSDRQEQQERWAVFWCSLLGPLLYEEIPPEQAGEFLRGLSQREHDFPDGTRRKPSRATLWRKWKKYRQGGFEGLFRKRRKDRGKPRKDTDSMIARAVELKKDQPLRSDEAINQFLQKEFGSTLPKSTLYRHLKKAGATRLKLGVSRKKVRKRWTRDFSNALWVGDFADGPYVWQGDKAVATHLSGFIDAHSRLVVEARYYLRENLDVLIDSLLRTWASHGASRELYLDNAKVYHAHALKKACCALNIKLLHRPVRDPAPGGLIERFFLTAQTQFETEVRAGDMLTLEKLNRALAAWLEQSYHRRIHSETKEAPRQRYEKGLRLVRHVNVSEVLGYFLQRDRRLVHKEFSDVQLNGKFFRVDAKHRGDKVEVRWDPFGELDRVLIYSLDGEYLGAGERHSREKGQNAPFPPESGKVKDNYLQLLIDQHEQSLSEKASGIDYPSAMARGQTLWPFTEFAKQLARRLGRDGGVSALTSDELERLQRFHLRHPRVDAAMLDEALANTQQRTLVEILYHLQHLHSQRSD